MTMTLSTQLLVEAMFGNVKKARQSHFKSTISSALCILKQNLAWLHKCTRTVSVHTFM